MKMCECHFGTHSVEGFLHISKRSRLRGLVFEMGKPAAPPWVLACEGKVRAETVTAEWSFGKPLDCEQCIHKLRCLINSYAPVSYQEIAEEESQ